MELDYSTMQMQAGSHPLEAGMMIGGRYRIAGVIGQGGMGVVYAAEDTRLQGKLRAVKAAGRYGSDYDICAEEARMLMRLSHPNVPQIVDYYPPDETGIEYVVMDYVHGETVIQRLSRYQGRMPVDEIVSIGLQLCDALSYLHEQTPQIIHRDLKPSNVMIDKSGHVRLIDFGIARFYKEGVQSDTVLLGTPGFAAPEQEGGSQSDARTDVYGLGALLYFLLSGGRTYAVGNTRLFESAELAIDVPPSLAAAVHRMVLANPSMRFASMRQVEEALMDARPIGRSINRMLGGRHVSDRLPNLTVILSAAPGAGATFVTMTLARLLANGGYSVSAIESSGQTPEWHAWLNGSRADGTMNPAPDGVFYRFEQPRIDWYCQSPDRPPIHADEEASFRLLVEQASNIRKSLLDLSSGWHERSGLGWLNRASTIIVVADPNPAKWSAVRMRQLFDELAAARGDGAKVLWIANKDIKFPQRSEWLSMFPEQPAASMPFIPHEEWMKLLWDGRWVTDVPAYRRTLISSFQQVIRVVIGEK
ncbi:protein kinase [Paenibacillus sp. PR3]|uniref:Protein kinase n=1 Tax=Paenibacillus terricola TaxID=2763503 RepID=A0ABR8MSK4_9BACL|nr:serine/threonine-protein kinase [Paenibacillus terricola]MBD3918958.1 protein kinase [Paenibacillus terricola]